MIDGNDIVRVADLSPFPDVNKRHNPLFTASRRRDPFFSTTSADQFCQGRNLRFAYPLWGWESGSKDSKCQYMRERRQLRLMRKPRKRTGLVLGFEAGFKCLVQEPMTDGRDQLASQAY